MNMLMIAPLCDSRGKIRYFIGAQVDVSGLVKDCTDLESLQQLVIREQAEHNENNEGNVDNHMDAKDDFQDLSEMLNMAELETVRKFGGRMHREYQDEEADKPRNGAPHMPRLLLQEPTADDNQTFDHSSRQSGRLSGIYQNVCVRRLLLNCVRPLMGRSIFSLGLIHLSVFCLLRRLYEYQESSSPLS